MDEGRLSEGATELRAALEEGAFVEVHPDDAERLGLADGGRAVVATDAGRATLPVRVTEHVAPGVVFVSPRTPCSPGGSPRAPPSSPPPKPRPPSRWPWEVRPRWTGWTGCCWWPGWSWCSSPS
ncbi:MAG: hypothetical protein HYU54_08875 [Actinobacteria bacterium]|nr:hypothetical protein [Actinomycetota bacterium]